MYRIDSYNTACILTEIEELIGVQLTTMEYHPGMAMITTDQPITSLSPSDYHSIKNWQETLINDLKEGYGLQ